MASAALAFRIFAHDNASAAFKTVAASADRLHSGLGALGRAGAAVGVTVKAGAVAAGAGLTAAATVGLKTASNMEQAQIAFTTMLGSAQKAQKFLGQLQKFAASTPFEFPELVRSSQKLLAMGFTAKSVVPTLTAIGDAVAGLGGGAEQIDQVTMAIGQMMAKGKVQGDELLQLTEVGIPALKILASGFHVSTERMQEMVTKGDVLSSKAIPLLVQGLEKGTKSTQAFGGMMEKQSHSMAGLWSTLKDNVQMTLSNLVQPAIPGIKKGLDAAARLVQTFGPKLQSGLGVAIQAGKDAGSRIGDEISSALNSDTANKIRSAWPVIASTVDSGVTSVAKAVRDRATDVGTSIFGGMQEGVEEGDWTTVGTGIGTALADSLHRGLNVAATMARTIGEGIRKIPWFTIATELGRQVPTLLVGLATGLLNFDLGSLLSGLAAHWQDVLLGILAIAFTPARWLGKIAELLGRIPLVGSLLKWAFDALTGFAKGVVTKVGEALSFMGRAFLDGFRKVFPAIGSAFAAWLKLLPTQIGVARLEVQAKAKEMVTGLGNAIKSGAGWVASKIGEIIGVILRPFAKAGGWLVGKGREVIVGLGNGLKSAFGAVTKFVAGIGKAILKAVGNLSKLLYNAGKQVIQGLIDGIQNMLGKLGSVVGSVGGKIKGAFSKVMGIFSPSRVMRQQGVHLMDGLRLGIESQAGTVVDSMTTLGRQLAVPELTGDSVAMPMGISRAPSTSDAQAIAAAVYEAICRALADARVQIDPSGVARLAQNGATRLGRR